MSYPTYPAGCLLARGELKCGPFCGILYTKQRIRRIPDIPRKLLGSSSLIREGTEIKTAHHISALGLLLCISLLALPVAGFGGPVNGLEPRSDGSSGSRLLYRVNCGGDTLTDIHGVTYSPDRAWNEGMGYGYMEGAATLTWHTIGGTYDERAYLTARHNFFRYRFAAPNDQYLVTLEMVDYESHAVGQNAFDIWIQATQVQTGLDIFDRVERDYVLKYRYLTTVTDGLLSVTGVQWPLSQISTIEVRSAEPDFEAPEMPVIEQVVNSFGCVLLNWYDNTEEDLKGYRVYRRQLPSGSWGQINTELSLVSRYLDFNADPDLVYQYRVAAVDVYNNVSNYTAVVEAHPLHHEETLLPLFQVTIDPADYALLTAYPDSELYVPAIVAVNDTIYSDAEIRYRGNVIRKLIKKSFKVKFSSVHPFRGEARKINLTAEFPDKTLLREEEAYQMFRDTGVPAPDTEPIHLVINNYNVGTYLMVEHPDEHFLENHNLEDSTLIYKCYDRLALLPDSAAYEEMYTKETFEDIESWGDIISLIEMLNTTPSAAVYDSLIRVF
ncbi:MAG: CotH kinase family protein, partial [Candidatus Eisenbacteria bacterium]|nr:CotH kinase family protein [Candidatus Eisenbacteria bacterium]